MGLNQTVDQLIVLVNNSKQHISLILKIIAGVWVFNIINWASGSVLNTLGVIPRSKRGLLGIFFSWSLHGNFNHLFFNSIPLFALSLLLISVNKSMFYNATILIILLEGLIVWLIARRGNHIGASGLIAGYFGLALIFAYKSATVVSIILGFIVLYYFGSILLSFFPSEDKTSWEGHLFGFLSGIASFFILFDYNFLPINFIKQYLNIKVIF